MPLPVTLLSCSIIAQRGEILWNLRSLQNTTEFSRLLFARCRWHRPDDVFCIYAHITLMLFMVAFFVGEGAGLAERPGSLFVLAHNPQLDRDNI